MHLAIGEGSRIDALVRTIFYLIGAPIFFDNHYNGSSNQTNPVSSDIMWSFSAESLDVPGNLEKSYLCASLRF